MVFWAIRFIFVLLVTSVLFISYQSGVIPGETQGLNTYKWIINSSCLFAVLFGLGVDLLIPRKKLAVIAGGFFGVFVGLLVGWALNTVLGMIFIDIVALDIYPAGIKMLVYVVCCYLGIIYIMQTKDDFRFIIPYVEFSKQTKGVIPLILDTSVIIDGRIADIVSTNLVSSPMIVPRFVLDELQNIADSADRMRRNRGRRGLDILNKMQEDSGIDISIQDISLDANEQAEPVDHKLVSVADKLSGKIVTNDYNLNKVASLRGVVVVNINDLAGALKSVVLPGEVMQIKVVKPGDQQGQGVAYLEDGTMVVVEQGRGVIGREVDVVITSALQTSAGRMIFAKLEDGSPVGGKGGGRPRDRSVNRTSRDYN